MNKKSIEKFKSLEVNDFVELHFNNGFFRGEIHFLDNGEIEVMTQGGDNPSESYSIIEFSEEKIKSVIDSVNTYAKAVIVLKK
jgi:hypothetical protein